LRPRWTEYLPNRNAALSTKRSIQQISPFRD
jgi:hypothetical protein